jgi:hypothetical protein
VLGPAGLLAAAAALLVTQAGCIFDADCGICDPQNLVLESISGVNYASKKIHVLGPDCTGERCTDPPKSGQYFVEDIGPCEQTDAALASPRGPEEFCRLSPLVTAYGVEFIFNNLLDATAIELIRKRPDQPKLYEVYDWKTHVVSIRGPITRFAGDVEIGTSNQPDVVSRAVNLACVDNLRDLGRSYGHEDYADPSTDPCNTTRTLDGALVPMKMRIGTDDAVVESYRGRTTHGSADAFDCITPEGGVDTCCTECDWLLSTKVAKYGVDATGERRTPNFAPGAPPGNGAIECDATAGAIPPIRAASARTSRSRVTTSSGRRTPIYARRGQSNARPRARTTATARRSTICPAPRASAPRPGRRATRISIPAAATLGVDRHGSSTADPTPTPLARVAGSARTSAFPTTMRARATPPAASSRASVTPKAAAAAASRRAAAWPPATASAGTARLPRTSAARRSWARASTPAILSFSRRSPRGRSMIATTGCRARRGPASAPTIPPRTVPTWSRRCAPTTTESSATSGAVSTRWR